jgi:hypothetical protein
MYRAILTISIVLSISLPLTAFAGPGGGASGDIPPHFESGSPSGILIQEAGGFTYGYNMNGLTITGEGALPALPAGYTLLGGKKLGWPDLDGNGITDYVIQHTSGFTYAYLMQDSGAFVSILSEGQVPGLPAGGYSTIGFPDLNGDTKSDICIQEPGGFTFCYLMDGLTTSSSGSVPGLPAAGYTTIGFPDLNGDDKSDIVIQHTGGFTFGYLMDGLSNPSSGALPGLPTATYTTLAFPDLNADKKADVVIQEAGGYTYAYLLDGVGAPTSSGAVPGLPGAGYSTLGFPDLNDDGKSDIVIQHTGGYTFAYLMDGVTTSSSGAVPGLPSATYVTRGWEEKWQRLP